MAKNNVKKNAKGYNYKYTDLAQIHEYLEECGYEYYQYIERIDTDDYVMTVKIVDGKESYHPIRGCRVVQGRLDGKTNPAQEQGSALTYARRYSLLMAFGLATTDDDAQLLDRRITKEEKLYVEHEKLIINGIEGRKQLADYMNERSERERELLREYATKRYWELAE